MKSTVTAFPIMIVMDGNEQKYNGSGKSEMDKTCYQNAPEYSHGNQVLVVESSFSGGTTIQQLISQYVLEQKSKIELDDISKENYNEPSNMSVVTSTKEDSK